MRIGHDLLQGAVAGAAGATALNAVTYADMASRGRGSSSAPQDTVEKIAGKAHIEIPGDDDTHSNRVLGLGSLNGIAVGIGVGAILGGMRGAGWRPGLVTTAFVAATTAMAVTDGTMTALGVTQPTKWGFTDWVADLVPHLAYGWVTAAALHTSKSTA